MKKFTQAVVAILSVLFISCMDYKEEIFLNKDMSGEIQISMNIFQRWKNFDIPKQEDVAADINSIQGLKLNHIESIDQDSVLKLKVFIAFESVNDLQRLFIKPYLHPYLGDISYTTNKKGHHVIRRLMQGKESPFFKEKEIIENLTLAEKKTMDLNSPWVWLVHPPSEVIYRTKGFRQVPGEPMEYGVNFKKVASSGVKLRLVFENENAALPINVWIGTGAFIFVMLLIGLGILLGGKTRKRKLAAK